MARVFPKDDDLKSLNLSKVKSYYKGLHHKMWSIHSMFNFVYLFAPPTYLYKAIYGQLRH